MVLNRVLDINLLVPKLALKLQLFSLAFPILNKDNVISS
jgi:hypothetical protein